MSDGSCNAWRRFLESVNNSLLILIILIFQITCLSKFAPAQEISEQRGGGCATQYFWEQVKDQVEMYDKSSACPTYGSCDDPDIRNQYLGGDTRLPVQAIRLYCHILREDDGSNPAVGFACSSQ